MQAESHKQLGKYLTDKFIGDAGRAARQAFKLGCIQPDLNPTTFFTDYKRFKFKGHKTPNTQIYIKDLLEKLDNQETWTVLSYYRLGKLIHYVADTFTHAHNLDFEGNMIKHVKYEKQLHKYLGDYLDKVVDKNEDVVDNFRIFNYILEEHSQYVNNDNGIENDVEFIVRATETVMAVISFNIDVASASTLYI